MKLGRGGGGHRRTDRNKQTRHDTDYISIDTYGETVRQTETEEGRQTVKQAGRQAERNK